VLSHEIVESRGWCFFLCERQLRASTAFCVTYRHIKKVLLGFNLLPSVHMFVPIIREQDDLRQRKTLAVCGIQI
jgi:hypothetical protein